MMIHSLKNSILFVNKKSYLVLLACFLFLLLSSCNKPRYLFEVKELNFLNGSDTILTGTKVDLDVLAMDEVIVSDSLLIITSKDPNGYIKIFNKYTNDSLLYILKEGRARNETKSPITSSKQVYYKGNDLILPMWDSNDRLMEVNITESLRSGRTEIGSVQESASFTRVRSVILNSDISSTFDYQKGGMDPIVTGRYILPKYFIRNGKKQKEIKVFPSIVEFEEPDKQLGLYFGCPYLNKQENIVVQPLQYLNYILFFNLESLECFAVHQMNSKSFDDKLDMSYDYPMCFCDCVICDDFFILLHKIVTEEKGEEAVYDKEIMLFDWNGSFLYSAILKEKVNSIGYDEERKVLYGLNRSKDMIYTYNIASIVDNI